MVNFDLAKSGFAVAPAASSDRAVAMLLPPLGDAAVCLTAVDGEHGLVIGAAAMTAQFRQQDPVGPGVALHVIEPCRGHGVGAALVAALDQLAGGQGARALYAMQRVESASPEATGWERLGFAPCASVQTHVLLLAEFEPRLGPLVARMRAKGKIPENARIVPLYAADADRVIDLHLRTMGGERDALAARIRGDAPDAFHPRYSRVLLVGDEVVGCILAHRLSREAAAVDANIVAEELRGGWANVWLKLEATRGALSLGIERFEFSSFDHYEDTRSFTARMRGATTRTTVLMRRLIGGR